MLLWIFFVLFFSLKAPLEQELKSVDSGECTNSEVITWPVSLIFRIFFTEAPTPDAVPIESAEKEMKEEDKTSETTRKGKKKKNIKWEIDERLVRYHYYEPDDEERGLWQSSTLLVNISVDST